MPSSTPNLGLISWSGSDKFDNGDLAANWSAIDTAVGGLLSKSGTDTLSGNITVTGTFQFGASGTIPFVHKTFTDTANYKAVEVAGTLVIEKPAVTDTALGFKVAADSDADDSLRFKIRADGRLYWGNGTAPDAVIYRDTTTSLAIQLGSDVDTANPTAILASPEKNKKYLGPGLRKQNLVWNPDFEVDNSGWSTTAISTVTNAATSITSATAAGTGAMGSKMGEITNPGASTNEGVQFKIYRKFVAGTQYNIKAKVYAASSSTPVQIGIGTAGVIYGSSTATALSSTWQELSCTWTPGASVNEASFFVRIPAQVAVVFAIDEVKVYVGSTPTIETSYFPIAETFPRWAVEVSNIAPTSNQQYIFAVPVEKGMVASRLSVLAGTTEGVGISSAEAGLYSIAPDVSLDTTPGSRFRATRLAQVANMENLTYQGPLAPIVWELDAPYRFSYTGIAYIGMVITVSGGGSAMPSLSGRANGPTNLFSVRGYNWYPLVGQLGTGVPISSSSLIALSSIGLPYAWIS